MKKRIIILGYGLLLNSFQPLWCMQDVLSEKIWPLNIRKHDALWQQLVRYTDFALVCKEWFWIIRPCIKMTKHKISGSSGFQKDKMLSDVVKSDQGTLGMVKFLVRGGADPQSKKWSSPIHVSWAWEDSIRLEKLDMMYYFVDTCEVAVDAPTPVGTPLIVACQHGDVPLVKLLIERGANWYWKVRTESGEMSAYDVARRSIKWGEMRKLFGYNRMDDYFDYIRPVVVVPLLFILIILSPVIALYERCACLIKPKKKEYEKRF